MFQPATTAGDGLGGTAWRALAEARPLRGAWAGGSGLIAAFTFALYSYLFSAFLPGGGLTLLGLRWLATRPAESDPAAAAAAPVPGGCGAGNHGALFLPLAINAWLVNDSEGQPGQAFANFAAGAPGAYLHRGSPAGWRWWVTAALVFFGLLVAAGLVWSV